MRCRATRAAVSIQMTRFVSTDIRHVRRVIVENEDFGNRVVKTTGHDFCIGLQLF